MNSKLIKEGDWVILYSNKIVFSDHNPDIVFQEYRKLNDKNAIITMIPFQNSFYQYLTSIPTSVKHENKGTYWVKGSCLTVPEGAILFDCTEHQRLHGCEHCPKKGKISVCQRAHEFITPPHTMADVEQQTDYTPNWRQP